MDGLDLKYVDKVIKAAGAGPLTLAALGILLMAGVAIAIIPDLIEQQPLPAAFLALAVLASIGAVVLLVHRASRSAAPAIQEGPLLNWASDVARRMHVALDGYVGGSVREQGEVWARLIQQLRLTSNGDDDLIARLRRSASLTLYNEITVSRPKLRKEIDAELKQADVTLS
ncbi:hypothetical protein [Terricaulis sp.]|uniref:hypothetical protein n=1 Tax=Terricaulis sp. TaxID=2768686 RepID=UPI003784CEFD